MTKEHRTPVIIWALLSYNPKNKKVFLETLPIPPETEEKRPKREERRIGNIYLYDVISNYTKVLLYKTVKSQQ